MPEALAILLATGAALGHATWNLLLKGSGDRLAFIWWSMLATVIMFLPVLVFLPDPFPVAVLPLLFASAVAECGYCILLCAAYARGPFSVVYPVARGTAPLFIAVWAFAFLGERPGLGGYTGIFLILTAITLVALPGIRTARRVDSAVATAVATGVCISIYSTIDKVAVQMISPLAYVSLLWTAIVALLAPYVWLTRGVPLMMKQLRIAWRSVASVGVLNGLTYLVILIALQFGPVSFIGAARESSIIFGALFGRFLLHEPVRPVHIAAVLTLFTGIAILVLVS